MDIGFFQGRDGTDCLVLYCQDQRRGLKFKKHTCSRSDVADRHLEKGELVSWLN
jgi:hypothetical protein